MKRFLVLTIMIFVVLLGACVTTGETSNVSATEVKEQPKSPVAEVPEAVGGSGTLVILHTNDHHGHPLSFYNYPAAGQGGLPARATLVDDIRGQYKNVLVLDAGDINTGRPESMFFDAEPDIIGYNYIGYDAAALGNHEFDKPHQILKNQMALAEFPFLSANVKYKTGGYVAEPYIIKEFNDLKVGIFGLTTTEINEIAGDVDTIKDLLIEDEVKAAKEMVAILKDREKVDVIVALTHLGNYSTADLGTRYVAANVPEIDLIIGGHTHMPDIMASGHWDMTTPFEENGVPIVITQEWGLQLGKVVMEIEDGEVTDLSWEMLPVNVMTGGGDNVTYVTEKIEEDPELLSILQPYADQVDAVLSEEIGTAADEFPSENVRVSETAVGDLVADALLWKTRELGAQFAIVNSGGIRSPIAKGTITKKDIYSCVPYDNSVFLLTMKGTDVLELFNTIGKIKQGKGGFPQVSSGISFVIDAGSEKVSDILINGKAVDPEGLYIIATNSFLAGGGDGYSVFKNAEKRYDTSVFQRDVLIEYIQSFGKPVEPKTYDRFDVINGVSMIEEFDDAA